MKTVDLCFACVIVGGAIGMLVMALLLSFNSRRERNIEEESPVEQYARELRQFPPCLTCANLKDWCPDSDDFYTFDCRKRNKGFNDAPLYCSDYTERENQKQQKEAT